MNYFNWELFIISPTEIICTILENLNFKEKQNYLPQIFEQIDDYINYILSEHAIYLVFDQMTIAFSVLISVLEQFKNQKLNEQISSLIEITGLDYALIKKCMNSVQHFLFETEVIEQIDQGNNSQQYSNTLLPTS